MNSTTPNKVNHDHIIWINLKVQGAPLHTGWKALREKIQCIDRELDKINIREIIGGMVQIEGYLFYCILMRILKIQDANDDVKMSKYADWIIGNNPHYTEASQLIITIRNGTWFKQRHHAYHNNLNKASVNSNKRSFNTAMSHSKGLASYCPQNITFDGPSPKRMKMTVIDDNNHNYIPPNPSFDYKQWSASECASFFERFISASNSSDLVLFECYNQNICGELLCKLNESSLYALGINSLKERLQIIEEIKSLSLNVNMNDDKSNTDLNKNCRISLDFNKRNKLGITEQKSESIKTIRFKVRTKKEKKVKKKWFEQNEVYIKCSTIRRIRSIWSKNIDWDNLKKGDAFWSKLSVFEVCSLVFAIKCNAMTLSDVKNFYENSFGIEYNYTLLLTPKRTGDMMGAIGDGKKGYYFCDNDTSTLLQQTWDILIEKNDFLKSLK